LKKLPVIFTISFCIFLISFSFAKEGIPNPTKEFYVNDFAGVLKSDIKQKIISEAFELKAKTTAQVVVMTIDSLQDAPIEEYAVDVFRKWGIGEKDRNNGVLLLVAIKDRKARIEVGYGLEGALPDGKSGRILKEIMNPSFKNGDYSTGILNGFHAVLTEVYKENGITKTYKSSNLNKTESEEPTKWNVGVILFIIFVFILRLLRGSRSRRRRLGDGFYIGSSYGGWNSSSGGDSGGGSSDSGGGGSSGGGGASDSW
jgi:uncharacterized protein